MGQGRGRKGVDRVPGAYKGHVRPATGRFIFPTRTGGGGRRGQWVGGRRAAWTVTRGQRALSRAPKDANRSRREGPARGRTPANHPPYYRPVKEQEGTTHASCVLMPRYLSRWAKGLNKEGDYRDRALKPKSKRSLIIASIILSLIPR